MTSASFNQHKWSGTLLVDGKDGKGRLVWFCTGGRLGYCSERRYPFFR